MPVNDCQNSCCKILKRVWDNPEDAVWDELFKDDYNINIANPGFNNVIGSNTTIRPEAVNSMREELDALPEYAQNAGYRATKAISTCKECNENCYHFNTLKISPVAIFTFEGCDCNYPIVSWDTAGFTIICPHGNVAGLKIKDIEDILKKYGYSPASDS